MTPISLLVMMTLMLLCSAAGTWLLRRYALARKLMDVPNARSSHSVATPRGGGLAFIVIYSAALLWLGASGYESWESLVGLLGAGLMLAVVGFMDDHGHIAARWRLLVHLAAAAWLLAWLGVPMLTLGTLDIEPGWWSYVVFGLALVWLLNLFNFMDGIDGIAGTEAITVCLGGVLCYWLIGQPLLGLPALLLAFAVLGFLFFNWPPAKIFMGDAGSGFLGILLGGLAVQAALVHPALLWSWVILLGVFVTDATITLFRRLMRRTRIYEAHRSHAYQRATRRHGGHLPVTLSVLLLNVFWLLPLACLVALGYAAGLIIAVVAYVPLMLVAWAYGAGLSDDETSFV
ncbi:Fuc2NAc and GlcNAc transferase [Halopseudomonas xinjiangensis]|uniref:Fuc2NAc and GlcNAc transferase n=1 Tax=Halopseudomonas xinjiangensis TaxID=487184 RepID=A0A1H1NMK6_9GAMM|nr:glycosyltransferase family 4 protein [Halopseudomonas xinjiangensis]SDS00113.1 Fuc2NAc and GlcNAc transferase [Halopseudomonas xinjiangensis]